MKYYEARVKYSRRVNSKTIVGVKISTYEKYYDMIHVNDEGFHPDNIIRRTNDLLNDKLFSMKIYNYKETNPRVYTLNTGQYYAKDSDLFKYINNILPSDQALGYVEHYLQ